MTGLKFIQTLSSMPGGHVIQNDGEARRTDTNNGNTVDTILMDYQAGPGGGNGLLRILTFDPDNNNMAVQTYSPFSNTFETDPER